MITEIDIRKDRHRLISFKSGQKNLLPQQGEFPKEIRAAAWQFMEEQDRKEYLKKLDYECIVDPVLHDYYMGDARKL